MTEHDISISIRLHCLDLASRAGGGSIDIDFAAKLESFVLGKHPAASSLPSAADAGGWIEWAGGDIPVPIDAKVQVRYYDGRDDTAVAGQLRWQWTAAAAADDIAAYRVVQP